MSATVRARIGLAAGAALALAALGACFSDKDGATGLPDPATQCRVPFDAIQRGDAVVAIRDFTFFPDSIVIPRGTAVTWVNCAVPSEPAHTSTSDTGAWDSPLLSPGDHYSRTFASPGVFAYHCTPHPFMQAKVVVQ